MKINIDWSFYKKLLNDISLHKKLYIIILPVVIAIAYAYSLGKPDFYRCTIKLAPETGDTEGSVLRNVAISLGIIADNDAPPGGIYLSLYPQVLTSSDFLISLMSINIRPGWSEKDLTYYDYLLNYQKKPWWSGLFGDPELRQLEPVDHFNLSPFQAAVLSKMIGRIKCEVDKRTKVISISVKDQDPLVAAVIADSVSFHLQKYLIQYHTNKARVDYDYYKKMCNQAKSRYDKAKESYTMFSDANRNVQSQSMLSKQNLLEEEMESQFNAYSSLVTLMIDAGNRIQEETPSFTYLQKPTVPIVKSEPDRIIIVIAFLLFIWAFLSLYVFYKEGDLSRLLLGQRALGRRLPIIRI